MVLAAVIQTVYPDVWYDTNVNAIIGTASWVIAGLATGLIEPAWDSLFTDDIEHSSAKHWSVWAGGSHLVAGTAALTPDIERGVLMAGAAGLVLFPFAPSVFQAEIDRLAERLAPRKLGKEARRHA